MANARRPDDRTVQPAPPRQFVADFMRMRPRERFARLQFKDYQRLNDMTPTERKMAIASMTSNEYYAVSQEDQEEFQHPEFHLDNMCADALLDFQLNAYRDRLAYERIMNSLDEFTADGRMSKEYADDVLRNVANAIKAADRWRGDEDFTDAIYKGTYGEQGQGQGQGQGHNAQAGSQQANLSQIITGWQQAGAQQGQPQGDGPQGHGQQGSVSNANNL